MSGHEHAWEPTGVALTVSGRKWQQAKTILYCPNCRKFGARTVAFLDGDIFKTEADAARANEDAWQQQLAERFAWLREHYPAHTAGEVG